MLKYIFNNYDKLLESARHSLFALFKKENKKEQKSLQLKPCDILEIEIKKQEANLKEKDSVEIKHQIRRKTLSLMLKQKALTYANMYIKRAHDLLSDNTEDALYNALEYLNRTPNNLSRVKLKEIAIYKAIIYELLEDFDEASKEHKNAIKLEGDEDALKEYKEFVVRSREVLSWHKQKRSDLRYSSLNIHNITKLEDMPNVAKRLDNIAKYYARSPKSRELGKRYFTEVIKMYKKLHVSNPKEYSCDYIKALIDGVELFMMSPTMLKKANELLLRTRDCTEIRVYLLEKIKELKSKDFIKKTKIFD